MDGTEVDGTGTTNARADAACAGGRPRVWARPRVWVRAGAWLLVPFAVAAWSAQLVAPVSAICFGIGAVGLVLVALAVAQVLVSRSRALAGVIGTVLVLGGLALFGLDPFRTGGGIDGWPAAVTVPAVALGSWWTMLALGVVLAGVAALVRVFLAALLAPRR